jgi:hypothetical protein
LSKFLISNYRQRILNIKKYGGINLQIKEYYKKSFKVLKTNMNMIFLTFLGILLMITLIKGIFTAIGLMTLNLSSIDIDNISLSELLISLITIFIFIVIFIYALIEAPLIYMAGKAIHKQKFKIKTAIFSNIMAGVKIFLLYMCMFIMILFWIVISTTIIGIINIVELSTVLNIIWILGIFSISLLFTVAPQSIVLNNKGVLGSIKESINLFIENKCKYAIVSFINLVFILLIFETIGLIDPILLIIVPSILSIVFIPFFNIILTHLYYDSKMDLASEN